MIQLHRSNENKYTVCYRQLNCLHKKKAFISLIPEIEHTRLRKYFVDSSQQLRPRCTAVPSTSICWCELRLSWLLLQHQVTPGKATGDLTVSEITLDSSENHEFSAPFISQLLKRHKIFHYNRLNLPSQKAAVVNAL